jgi:hypothetical protein
VTHTDRQLGIMSMCLRLRRGHPKRSSWNWNVSYTWRFSKGASLIVDPDVTAQDVQAFSKELLARIYIETLIHGNHSPGVS